jgi:cytosine/adenosine deaminase-related metal-dependent hydrolase
MANGPADVYIKTAKYLLTMDPQRRLLEGASVAIKGDRIAAIGEDRALEGEWVGPDTRAIDASERFVTPGFVNAHIHLESCYDKGLLDDVPVVPWCERYFSYTYGTLTDESYYYAALASLLACLKSGTTTVSDCGTIQTMEASAVRALSDIGMRGVLARDLMDIHTATKSDYVSYDAFTDLLGRLQEDTQQCLDRSERFIQDYNDTSDGRVRTWLDLQQVCNCSPELCKGVKKLADGYGVGVQTHAAVSHDMAEMTRKRFGMRDIEYLHAQGVTGRNFLAAHMAWTDAAELIMLKETDSNVVHVPGSSAHGVYSALSSRGKIPEYVKAGINVAIGNDESSTGTCHDIVRDMYLVSTIHAEARHPMIFPDPDLFMLRTSDENPRALEMATLNGARALNWEDDIGSVEVGKKADIALYDLTSYEWIPTVRENLINNFIYNGTGRSCDTVICDGQVIMEGKRVLTIDEDDVRRKAQAFAEQYVPTAPWLQNPEVWELKWVRE